MTLENIWLIGLAIAFAMTGVLFAKGLVADDFGDGILMAGSGAGIGLLIVVTTINMLEPVVLGIRDQVASALPVSEIDGLGILTANTLLIVAALLAWVAVAAVAMSLSLFFKTRQEEGEG